MQNTKGGLKYKGRMGQSTKYKGWIIVLSIKGSVG